MNYDESILQEQYSRDDTPVEGLEKVWMVVYDRGNWCLEFSAYSNGKIFFDKEKLFGEISPIYSNIELGWIYSRDICEDYYKHFNVVESYGT